MKSYGEVNLRAARKEASWFNRATLGVFGREEQNSSEEKIEQPKQTTERSFTNRISFGLLDRPETQQNITTETE